MKIMRFAAIKDKLREKHLGWFGYLMRRKKCQVMRQAMELVVEGLNQYEIQNGDGWTI